MKIRRVYTAIIRNGEVLMVRHVHDGRDYWTLPGGHVETGETPENAAAREVEEETGLTLIGLRQLFTEGDERCFVATCHERARATIGTDPELLGTTQIIVDVAWFGLVEKANDVQVAKVLHALGQVAS